MRCKAYNCTNNDNGYCDISSYIEIDENGYCEEFYVFKEEEGDEE